MVRETCRIHRSELIQDNVCKGGTIRDRPIICLSDYCFKYCAIICICVCFCCPIADNIKNFDAAYSLFVPLCGLTQSPADNIKCHK